MMMTNTTTGTDSKNIELTEVKSTEIVLYNDDVGDPILEVNIAENDVWLTQAQMAELFGTSKQNIGQRIQKIFEVKELDEDRCVKDSFTHLSDQRKFLTKYYNLDMIISVGYRVNSKEGTRFRKWATQILKDYATKGFVLDEDKLKNPGNSVFFEELQRKAAEIRVSEKTLDKKLLAIFQTSVDYNINAQETMWFIQNMYIKFHLATSGQEPKNIVYERADYTKDNMGLTTTQGRTPKKFEVANARNYLTPEEHVLYENSVNAFLDFATDMALRHVPMTMQNWLDKFDELMKLYGREVAEPLPDNPVNREKANRKAHEEYAKFKERVESNPTPLEQKYQEYMDKQNSIETKPS